MSYKDTIQSSCAWNTVSKLDQLDDSSTDEGLQALFFRDGGYQPRVGRQVSNTATDAGMRAHTILDMSSATFPSRRKARQVRVNELRARTCSRLEVPVQPVHPHVSLFVHNGLEGKERKGTERERRKGTRCKLPNQKVHILPNGNPAQMTIGSRKGHEQPAK